MKPKPLWTMTTRLGDQWTVSYRFVESGFESRTFPTKQEADNFAESLSTDDPDPIDQTHELEV